MQPASVGSRVRVVSNEYDHSYTVGRVYTVTTVDSDGTFRAADCTGRVGNWLRWSECTSMADSLWTKLAAELPDTLVRFLSCFDGINDLTLKETVIDAVLAKLPDLHERVVAAAGTAVGEDAIAANRPPKLSPEKPQPTQPGRGR